MPQRTSSPGRAVSAARVFPNQTMRLLIERASCRSFKHRDIPEKVLNFILEAGTRAPTGGNLQPYSIIRIKSKASKMRLAGMCGQKFIGHAPVDLLFCLDWRRLQRWARLEDAPFSATGSFRHFWISFQDTVICAQNICTAADAMGLGSVYIGTVLECFGEIIRMFKLPRGVFPVVLLCLGYPDEPVHARKKMGADVIVHQERYRDLNDRTLKRAFEKKYPAVRIDATVPRLRRLVRVSRKVHGDAFAHRCAGRVKRDGHINAAQRYFGLHYNADYMPAHNERFLKIMERSGFTWFRKIRFPLSGRP